MTGMVWSDYIKHAGAMVKFYGNGTFTVTHGTQTMTGEWSKVGGSFEATFEGFEQVANEAGRAVRWVVELWWMEVIVKG